MTTEAPAPEPVNDLSDEEIERLEDIMSVTLTEAVEKCGAHGLPTLLRHIAKRLEREASTLDADRPPVDAKASHTQLMISLGKKEENVNDFKGPLKGEGVPEVEFTPTFFGDAAKAVRFKNREGEFVSWGFSTDFAPFEQFLWPLFKEIKEGTMAVETGSGPEQYIDEDMDEETPEWKARKKDKELAIKVAKEIGLSFWTTVLATVRVQGWRAPWMLMVLFLILVSYPT